MAQDLRFLGESQLWQRVSPVHSYESHAVAAIGRTCTLVRGAGYLPRPCGYQRVASWHRIRPQYTVRETSSSAGLA
jgi:hypothetical protein